LSIAADAAFAHARAPLRPATGGIAALFARGAICLTRPITVDSVWAVAAVTRLSPARAITVVTINALPVANAALLPVDAYARSTFAAEPAALGALGGTIAVGATIIVPPPRDPTAPAAVPRAAAVVTIPVSADIVGDDWQIDFITIVANENGAATVRVRQIGAVCPAAFIIP
jgi:hypothetical protein